MIEKENEMLWRKQTPMVMDGNYCPVCGNMQFVADYGYCKVCGQALKFEGVPTICDGPPSLAGEGTITDDTEIGMIENINDRT